MSTMPRFLATLGVKVLRSVPLRQAANQVRCGLRQEGRRWALPDEGRAGVPCLTRDARAGLA